MVKKLKKISKKKEVKKSEERKVNKYTIYLGTFALIVILMLVVYYSSFIQIVREPERYREFVKPTVTEKPEVIEGGFCKRDSECFITYCKGSDADCVNTTQLSDYNKNCRTYTDWIIEMQDISKCACIQNSCTIIK